MRTSFTISLACLLIFFFATPLTAQWVHTNGPHSGACVLALAVSGTKLFAGTSGGVFLSTNSGSSWVKTGLTDFYGGLAVSGTKLFAGTSGGVFLSTNSGSSWVKTGLTDP
ncbi:MAG: hypothetical protein ABSF91_12815, partial [Bacteroidota bacterium]